MLFLAIDWGTCAASDTAAQLLSSLYNMQPADGIDQRLRGTAGSWLALFRSTSDLESTPFFRELNSSWPWGKTLTYNAHLSEDCDTVRGYSYACAPEMARRAVRDVCSNATRRCRAHYGSLSGLSDGESCPPQEGAKELSELLSLDHGVTMALYASAAKVPGTTQHLLKRYPDDPGVRVWLPSEVLLEDDGSLKEDTACNALFTNIRSHDNRGHTYSVCLDASMPNATATAGFVTGEELPWATYLRPYSIVADYTHDSADAECVAQHGLGAYASGGECFADGEDMMVASPFSPIYLPAFNATHVSPWGLGGVLTKEFSLSPPLWRGSLQIIERRDYRGQTYFAGPHHRGDTYQTLSEPYNPSALAFDSACGFVRSAVERPYDLLPLPNSLSAVSMDELCSLSFGYAQWEAATEMCVQMEGAKELLPSLKEQLPGNWVDAAKWFYPIAYTEGWKNVSVSYGTATASFAVRDEQLEEAAGTFAADALLAVGEKEDNYNNKRWKLKRRLTTYRDTHLATLLDATVYQCLTRFGTMSHDNTACTPETGLALPSSKGSSPWGDAKGRHLSGDAHTPLHMPEHVDAVFKQFDNLGPDFDLRADHPREVTGAGSCTAVFGLNQTSTAAELFNICPQDYPTRARVLHPARGCILYDSLSLSFYTDYPAEWNITESDWLLANAAEMAPDYHLAQGVRLRQQQQESNLWVGLAVSAAAMVAGCAGLLVAIYCKRKDEMRENAAIYDNLSLRSA